MLAAEAAVLEIARRLGTNTWLTGQAMTTLLAALIHVIEQDRARSFLFPETNTKDAPKRKVGRPAGSKNKTDLGTVLRRYGEARGILPIETISSREAQRIRAQIRGAPGNPGRPKKSDKKSS